MSRDFRQLEWDETLQDDCRQIVRLAIREDLDRYHDWTTVSLVPQSATGSAAVVARSGGVIAGLPAAELAIHEMNAQIAWSANFADGQSIDAGQTVATLRGSTRDILTCERIVLNLLGRLTGIATLTRRYVDAVAGTKAAIYDTRKTTPGWRRLEKYAVGRGGGRNHRTGLFDAILIKDNHLASLHDQQAVVAPDDATSDMAKAIWCRTAAEAVQRAKDFVADQLPPAGNDGKRMIVEVEVDTLDQFERVLPAGPDIVLLDNMSLDQLRAAVAIRDGAGSDVELEASGGVNLETVAAIAETGIDRISVGALTHSAASLDLGLDWST